MDYDYGKKLPWANTVLLIIVVGLAIAILVYTLKCASSSALSPAAKENMQGGRNKVFNALKENACGGLGGCGSGPTSGRVIDGNDYANQFSGNAFNPNAKLNCPPKPIPEAFHPYSSGAATYKLASQAYNSNYPDETSPNSLDAQAKYGCAQDVHLAPNNCDYSLNTDSLMPGSWREGTQCPDGSDPNSQWAKYSPSRDSYMRYITASSAARLGVNTRNASSRIVGLPLLLRSSTTTPLSHSQFAFNGSSLRDDVLADSTGIYPGAVTC